ncbi:hypothetical protein ANN_04081 [Periplaneta americana]|uniref:Uncharacterized protein n=1 Tax=Periplaneta americana TaxID=6978 RepID=A0ABQ8T7L0_PERAM|nr:hypothetical protein ANN_04081 [Periplaneta americana]
MNPGSSTESYPAFALIGLRENPRKNLNQQLYFHIFIRLPNLDIVRETTLKYTNMPEENAKKNTGHHATRQNDNEILQRLTNTTDAAERATATKWTWVGGEHVARLHQTRWTHAVTMWDLYVGKRGQGRPRLRWSDMFTKEVRKQWSRTAKNRVLWKELEKIIVKSKREADTKYCGRRIKDKTNGGNAREDMIRTGEGTKRLPDISDCEDRMNRALERLLTKKKSAKKISSFKTNHYKKFHTAKVNTCFSVSCPVFSHGIKPTAARQERRIGRSLPSPRSPE